jgi:ribosomal protein S18 acetylase RimI-like enzyme
VPLEIVPLTPDRLADLASLFEQGGDPKRCWCSYFHVRGRGWDDWDVAANRALLEARAHAERPPGLVAYRDGEAVGWVSVAPREDYARIVASRVLAPVDDRPVWSIVCFVVGRQARRSGIARALLDAAVDFAAERGATIVEAYPVDTAGARISSASAYRGTLAMFRRAGFEVVAERRSSRNAPVRPIVRRVLASDGPD